MTFQLFGLNFHVYGLVVGVAVSLGIFIAEYLAKKQSIPEKTFWQVVLTTIVAGLLGARMYHVWTDWGLYHERPENIFKVWQGGLSIIGALIGGAIGIVGSVFWLSRSTPREKLPSYFSRLLLTFADIGVLSLPFSQAVGRLANFFNQELYGTPTDLPWAVFIEPRYRAAGYHQYDRFHPLFAYEAGGMLVCGVLLWLIYRKKIWKVGDGNFTLLYFGWYGLFRSALEFLRIEKSYLAGTMFGLNQAILFIVGLLCMGLLFHKTLFSKKVLQLFMVISLLFVTILGFSSCQVSSQEVLPAPLSVAEQHQLLLQKKDYTVQPIRFRNEATDKNLDLEVEVVTSRAALAKGLGGTEKVGKDGMLFVFTEKARHGIWMKNMQYDLDLIWITDGKVAQITPMVEDPPGNSPGLTYHPDEPVEMIMEVPAGMTTTWQLQVGDGFELR